MMIEQLALWDDDRMNGVPLFDRADVLANSPPGGGLRINDNFAVNGLLSQRADYPEFRQLDHMSAEMDTLAHLPTTVDSCPYCGTHSESVEKKLELVERGAVGYEVIYRQDFCRNCLFWQHTELRNQSHLLPDELLVDHYHLTVLSSRLRDFEAKAPDGTLTEIAQWFRRYPNLYQSVAPHYLEKLVAKVFADLYTNVEVTHVGRPDDGGVDVVMVEGEGKTWLVQVKRREHTTTSEPVSTVRHLLGTMLLAGTRFGAVVSSADHFTHRARQAVASAAKVGYTVRLYDRHAFDRLLGEALLTSPWAVIDDLATKDRWRWAHDDDSDYKAKPGLIGSRPEHFFSTKQRPWSSASFGPSAL